MEKNRKTTHIFVFLIGILIFGYFLLSCKQKDGQETNQSIPNSNEFTIQFNQLNEAIELDPNNADAYYDRGFAKWEMGDDKGAIQDFTKAIELKPNHADAYYYRGVSKKTLSDYRGAIKDFTKAIELNPDFQSAYYQRGKSQFELSNYKKAIKDYSKAIEASNKVGKLREKDADYGEIKYLVFQAGNYLDRGIAKAKLGNYAGAIKDYNEAIQLYPDDADAYINRGAAKYDLGDYKGAIQDYDKAIELNPDDELAYGMRANTKHILGNYKGSIEDYNKEEENTEAWDAAIDAINRRYAEVEESKERIATLYSQRPDWLPHTSVYTPHTPSTFESFAGGIVIAIVIFLVLLYLFVFSGKSIGPRYKKYLQETQRSLLLNKFPQLTDGDLYDIQTTRACDLIRYILQQEYFQLYIQKHYQVLEKLMDKGMEIGGPYRAITLWLNGEITKKAAIDRLSDINSDPDDYRSIFRNTLNRYLADLAEFYIDRGSDKSSLQRDNKGAIQDFDLAIELNPNSAYAYYWRGSAKYSMRDYEGALQDCNMAIELNNLDENWEGRAYYKRGLVKIALGQKDNGCLDLSKADELGYSMAKSSIKEYCQ